MNEFFELLDELCFPTENDGAKQLAFIGNQVPQYVRLCSTPDAFNRTLFPTFGIVAASARPPREEDEPPLSTDRFVQEYGSADEAKRDELCPKVAIGISALLLQLIHFDNELSVWLGLSIEETKPIFERYFFANVVKGRTLTNEQLAKLGAKHIGMEQTYLDETRKQWAKHLPDHPEPLTIAISAADRYIEFVKVRARLTDNPETSETDKEQRESGKRNKVQPFVELMIDDDKGIKLSILHSAMKNKKGKQAAIIICAASEIGWLLRPTFTQVKNEFGSVGAKSGFNRYFNDASCNDDVERMKEALRNALSEHL